MTRKLLTPEERQQRRLQRAREDVATSTLANVQVYSMLYQHEALQRAINAILQRWADEMLMSVYTCLAAYQDISHDD